MKMFKVMKNWI